MTMKQPSEKKKNDLGEMFSRRGPGCNAVGTGLWLVLALLLSYWLMGWLNSAGRVEISYTAFREQVQAGNVASITVSGEQIDGTLVNPAEKSVPDGDPVQYSEFTTFLPSFGDDTLLSMLENQGVEIQTQPASNISWLDVLFTVGPFLLLIGFFYLVSRRMRAQGQNILSVGRSRAQLYDRRKEKTTFDDVAGSEGVKTELREIIEFLKNPERFRALGGEMPRGVLLIGPPGTGKTLLARAVAGEAGVPFYSITGSDFMEMFVGVGASRVRNMFDDAKKSSPAIIFIDELDSIGRRRGTGLGGGHDEREQTLNQLLSEMDGFEVNHGVVVMAATNRPDILDPALLRPGRFDRRVTVELPTMQDREEILKIHSRHKPLSGDVDLKELARGTPGFSGADLENLLNEAALLAARKEKHQIEKVDIEQARDKVLLGLARKNLMLTDEECRMLAYHEGGHAIVAASLPHADPIHKVTIVPRGRAMGVTQQLPEKDKYIYPREYMLERLAVMMGGRAAEELVMGTATSGAENDLKQATQLARRMVLDWGMSEKLGPLAFGGRHEQVFLGEDLVQGRSFSETTAYEVDQEVRSILIDAYDQARDVLEKNRRALDRLADALLEKEEIPGAEVERLLADSSES